MKKVAKTAVTNTGNTVCLLKSPMTFIKPVNNVYLVDFFELQNVASNCISYTSINFGREVLKFSDAPEHMLVWCVFWCSCFELRLMLEACSGLGLMLRRPRRALRMEKVQDKMEFYI